MAYRLITKDAPSKADGGSVYDKPVFQTEPLGPIPRMPPPPSDDRFGPIVQLPNGLFQFSHLAEQGPDPDWPPPPPRRPLHPPHGMNDGAGPFPPRFPGRGFGRSPLLDRGGGPEWWHDWRDRDGFPVPPFRGPPSDHGKEEEPHERPFPSRRAGEFSHPGEADRFGDFRPSWDSHGSRDSWRHDVPCERGRSASSERGRFERLRSREGSPGRGFDGLERHPSEPRSGSVDRNGRLERGEHVRDTELSDSTAQGGPFGDRRNVWDMRTGNKSFGRAQGAGPEQGEHAGPGSLSEAIRSAQGKKSDLRSSSPSERSREPRKPVDGRRETEGESGRKRDRSEEEGLAKIGSRGEKGGERSKVASSAHGRSRSPRIGSRAQEPPQGRTSEGVETGRSKEVLALGEIAKAQHMVSPSILDRAERRKTEAPEVDKTGQRAERRADPKGESKNRVVDSEPRRRDPSPRREVRRKSAGIDQADARVCREKGIASRSRLVRREVAGRIVYDDDEMPSRDRERTRRADGGHDAERADGRRERQGARAPEPEARGSRQDRERRKGTDIGKGGRTEASRELAEGKKGDVTLRSPSGKIEGSRRAGTTHVPKRSRLDREQQSGLPNGGSGERERGLLPAKAVASERRETAKDGIHQKRERERETVEERERRLRHSQTSAVRNEERTKRDTWAASERSSLPSSGLLHSTPPSGSEPSSFVLFGQKVRPLTRPDDGLNLLEKLGKGKGKMQIDGPDRLSRADPKVGDRNKEDLDLSLCADARLSLPLFEVKPTEPLLRSHSRHQAVRDVETVLTLSPRGESFSLPIPTQGAPTRRTSTRPLWPSSDSLKRAERTNSKATQTHVEDFPSPSFARRLIAMEAHPLYRECFTGMPEKDPERAPWAADFSLNLGSCIQRGPASDDGEGLGAEFGTGADESTPRLESGGDVWVSGRGNSGTEAFAANVDTSRQGDDVRSASSVPKRPFEWLCNPQTESQPHKVRKVEEGPPADIWQDDVPAGAESAQVPVALPGLSPPGSADEAVNQNASTGGEDTDDGFWDPSPGPGQPRRSTEPLQGGSAKGDGNLGSMAPVVTTSAWKKRDVSPAAEDIPLKFYKTTFVRAKQTAVKGFALGEKPGQSLLARTAVSAQLAVQDEGDLTGDGDQEQPGAAEETRGGQKRLAGEAPASEKRPQCALCGKGPSVAQGDWYCADCGRRDDTCTCVKPLRAHNKWKRKYAVKYSGPKAVVHKLCAFWTPSVYQPGDGQAFVGLKKAVIDSTGSPNHGGKKLTPVRCTFCNEVGATSRCRVESTCHSVYHYTCAIAAGCRMTDCLEDQGLSVACPDHFHVALQVRKGTPVPHRQLPWTAVKGSAKRQKTTTPKAAKSPPGKALVTVPVRKSTIRKTWKDLDEEEEPGSLTGVAEIDRAGGVPNARREGVDHPPEVLAIDLGKTRRRGVTPSAKVCLSPGALSPFGKKSLGNRELRSILADVPKPRELPSVEEVEEQQRKKREKLLASKQAAIRRERAALLEELSEDAGLLALVRDWAPSVFRVMGRLREEAKNGAAKHDAEYQNESEKAPKHGGGEKDESGKVKKENDDEKGESVNGQQSSGHGRSLRAHGGNVDDQRPQCGQNAREDGVNGHSKPEKEGQGGRGGHRDTDETGLEMEIEDIEGRCEERTPAREGPLSGLQPSNEETKPGTGVATRDDSTGTSCTELVHPVEFNFDSDGETVELAGADKEETAGGGDTNVVAAETPRSVNVTSGVKEDQQADVLRGLVKNDAVSSEGRGNNLQPAKQGPPAELLFECAACGATGASSDMEQHPALPVILCTDCLESFNSADFSDRCGQGVERYCQLCGRKAKQRPRCDECCKTLCQDCLGRVVGAEQQAAIAHLDDWSCFACDLTQLKELAAEVERLQDARKGKAGLEGRVAKKEAGSEGGVGANSDKEDASHGRCSQLSLEGLDGQAEMTNTVKGEETGLGNSPSRSDQDEKRDRAGKNDVDGLTHAAKKPVTSLSVTLPDDATSDPDLEQPPLTVSPDGARGYACTVGGCSRVFPSFQARAGHMGSHGRASARGRGTSGQLEPDISIGRRGRDSSGEGEGSGADTPGKSKAADSLEVGVSDAGKKGGTSQRQSNLRAVDGRTDGCGAARGPVGLEGAEDEGRGEEREASRCAACGASLGANGRRHPKLPVVVCQECETQYNSADFTNKDVRGWERACQVCGHVASAVDRLQCEGPDCHHSTCATCIGRVLRNGKESSYLSDDVPWLCFACDTDRLEDEHLADGAGSRKAQLNAIAAKENGGTGLKPNGATENGDSGGNRRREQSPKKKVGPLGKRSLEGVVTGAVSEHWGFCQCNRCADRYTGKKDAQSHGLKHPSNVLPSPRKSGSRPWAAYSRVGSRLVNADLSGGKEKVPIPVSNDVDDDVSALDMDYITDLRLHPDLADFHERFDPAAGCAGCCSSDADDPEAPLNKHVRDLALFEGYDLRTGDDDRRVDWQQERMQGRLFYDQNGLLQLPPDAHPTIIECNPRCPCWPDCPNATLQRGSSVHLEVFKTDNGRGFGVRSREDIQRGQLIGRYVGEVITSEEANRRNSVYLFNMDHHVRSADQHEEIYVIDGGPASSVIRYINHSCDPNLAVYSVYTDTLHPGKPCLALYAIKDIVAGTELAYDYKYGDPGQADSDSKIECRCGAANCQLWLPDPAGIKSESQD